MAPQLISLRKNFSWNLILSICCVALFRLISLSTGKIEANAGLGYDGVAYAKMVTDGLIYGFPDSQLRVLPVLLTKIPYYLTRDIIKSFVIMNHVYLFLLCFLLCLIFDFYSEKSWAKVFFVLNTFSCIAVAKMFAYYPTLVDLGAYAAITAALYFLVINHRLLAGITCLLAILSREFAIALIAFGIVRDLRTGSLSTQNLLTYLPSVIVFFLLRVWVNLTNAGVYPASATSLVNFANNLAKFCGDPVFVSFFCYFLTTLFGGVSLLLFSRSALCGKYLSQEPEYAVFLLLIVGVSAAGTLDLWRYLAYILPVAAMLFARYSADLRLSFRQQAPILLLATYATILTQRPLMAINLDQYFEFWFPLYIYVMEATGSPVERNLRFFNFEVAWLALFVIAIVSVLLLSLLHRQSDPKTIG